MSNKAWGIIELTQAMDPPTNDLDEPFNSKTAIDLAFSVTSIATKNRIGIKFGGNVTREYLKLIERKPELLPFELLDDPIMNVAHGLFSCDDHAFYDDHEPGGRGESIESRMNRIQRFLEETILASNDIKRIILNLDAMSEGNEPSREIKANDFKNLMLSLYKKYNGCAPSVSFSILK
jgi:hypothetical protein